MKAWTLHELGALCAALECADEFGFLVALTETPATVDELAASKNLHATGVARVLEVLRTQGLLECDGTTYRASDAIRYELAGIAGLRGTLRSLWQHAPSFVSTGAVHPAFVDRSSAYAKATPRLSTMFREASEKLAVTLAKHVPGNARVLDVGAGAGAWSLAFLREIQQAHVTAFDLEGVLPRFLEHAEQGGLSDRVSTIAGNYDGGIELEPGFDVVLAANVLHLEPAEQAERLVASLAGVCKPGGVVIVVDLVGDGTAELERIHAAYAFNLALRLPGAFPHREPDIRRWMAAAGCPVTERIDLPAPVQGAAALVGTRSN